MQKYIAFLLLSLMCFSAYAQSKKDLISLWDGGEAFDGMYEEKNFLIEFTGSDFRIQYGPNHYTQYSGYVLEKDILTITRSIKNNKQYQPRFRIIKLDSSELVLEAVNWAAVYITSVLSGPYLGDADEDMMVNNPGTDLTAGDRLNIRLTFTRK